MIRVFIGLVGLLLWAAPVQAQSPQCPTPAVGGSAPIANTPTCASQAFVTSHFPSSAIAGHIATFSDSTGQKLSDGGTVATLINALCTLSPTTCVSIFGYSNVIWWGANNNGSVDSTTAIQAALTSSCSTAAVVFFPGGSYLVSATLNITCSFLSIQGSGSVATFILRHTNFGDTFLFQGTAPARLQGLSISGLRVQFDTVVPNSGANLHFVACDFVNISDVFFNDNFIGMQFDGVNNQLISNATIIASAGNSTGRIGMLIQKAPSGWGSVIGSGPNATNLTIASTNTNPGFANDLLISGVDGVWFTNSYFGPAASVNVAMTNTDPTVSSNDGLLISNSWFDLGHGGTHFQTNGSSVSNFGNIVLTGNIFIGGAQNDQGLNIGGNASNITITGNTFDGFQKQAIQLAGTASDFVIANNKLTNFNKGGSGFAAIQLVGSGGKGAVSGNVIDLGGSSNSLGIWLSGTTNEVTVSGNTVTNTNQGVLIDNGVTIYNVQVNTLHGNTTALTDNGGAVTKLVQNNLN